MRCILRDKSVVKQIPNVSFFTVPEGCGDPLLLHFKRSGEEYHITNLFLSHPPQLGIAEPKSRDCFGYKD